MSGETLKNTLIAAIAGGLVVFVWTAIAHMATPLGTAGMSVFPPDQESKLIDAMKAGVPASGLYFFPGIDMRSTPTPEQQKAWEEKIQAGPFGLLVFNARGGSPLSPAQLVTELASTMLAAAVAAYLASLMVAPMMTRAIAVALLALFASLSIGASYWNWYGFPTAFVAAEAFTELIGWLLGGLAIARIVPAAGAPAARLPL
jgi:hypothetical protein